MTNTRVSDNLLLSSVPEDKKRLELKDIMLVLESARLFKESKDPTLPNITKQRITEKMRADAQEWDERWNAQISAEEQGSCRWFFGTGVAAGCVSAICGLGIFFTVQPVACSFCNAIPACGVTTIYMSSSICSGVIVECCAAAICQAGKAYRASKPTMCDYSIFQQAREMGSNQVSSERKEERALSDIADPPPSFSYVRLSSGENESP